MGMPDFIVQLRKLGEAKTAKAAELKAAETLARKFVQPPEQVSHQLPSPSPFTPNTNGGFPDQPYANAYAPTFSPDDFSVMDDMSMDWHRWDSLLNDVDIPARVIQAPTMHPAQMHFLGAYGQQGYSWPLTAHRAQ
jgi:hypothetical protein